MIGSKHIPWTATEEQHMTTAMVMVSRRVTVEERIVALPRFSIKFRLSTSTDLHPRWQPQVQRP
jgi:hypothetical protein